MTDDFIGKAKGMEKIGSAPETQERILAILNGSSQEPPDLSGVTQTQIRVETSVLDESS